MQQWDECLPAKTVLRNVMPVQAWALKSLVLSGFTAVLVGLSTPSLSHCENIFECFLDQRRKASNKNTIVDKLFMRGVLDIPFTVEPRLLVFEWIVCFNGHSLEDCSLLVCEQSYIYRSHIVLFRVPGREPFDRNRNSCWMTDPRASLSCELQEKGWKVKRKEVSWESLPACLLLVFSTSGLAVTINVRWQPTNGEVIAASFVY